MILNVAKSLFIIRRMEFFVVEVTIFILLLLAAGIFLGLQYSLGPIKFKGRGVGHLVCLWLLLYFLPMLYAALLIANILSASLVILAAAYATVEMGIILINTSEDFPED